MSKKIKPIRFNIDLGIYPYNVIVSIGDSDKSLDKYLVTQEVINDRHLAQYGQNGHMKYVVWPEYQLALIRMKDLPRSSSDYAGLSHEILHVVISILRAIGMRISDDGGSDEAYTYLMSMITGMIYKEINQYY